MTDCLSFGSGTCQVLQVPQSNVQIVDVYDRHPDKLVLSTEFGDQAIQNGDLNLMQTRWVESVRFPDFEIDQLPDLVYTVDGLMEAVIRNRTDIVDWLVSHQHFEVTNQHLVKAIELDLASMVKCLIKHNLKLEPKHLQLAVRRSFEVTDLLWFLLDSMTSSDRRLTLINYIRGHLPLQFHLMQKFIRSELEQIPKLSSIIFKRLKLKLPTLDRLFDPETIAQLIQDCIGHQLMSNQSIDFDDLYWRVQSNVKLEFIHQCVNQAFIRLNIPALVCLSWYHTGRLMCIESTHYFEIWWKRQCYRTELIQPRPETISEAVVWSSVEQLEIIFNQLPSLTQIPGLMNRLLDLAFCYNRREVFEWLYQQSFPNNQLDSIVDVISHRLDSQQIISSSCIQFLVDQLSLNRVLSHLTEVNRLALILKMADVEAFVDLAQSTDRLAQLILINLRGDWTVDGRLSTIESFNRTYELPNVIKVVLNLFQHNEPQLVNYLSQLNFNDRTLLADYLAQIMPIPSASQRLYQLIVRHDLISLTSRLQLNFGRLPTSAAQAKTSTNYYQSKYFDLYLSLETNYIVPDLIRLHQLYCLLFNQRSIDARCFYRHFKTAIQNVGSNVVDVNFSKFSINDLDWLGYQVDWSRSIRFINHLSLRQRQLRSEVNRRWLILRQGELEVSS